MSKLYIVGTPIGNLGDMSPRAIQVLSSVGFIAAEDTRVTRKLLTHFEIRTPLISYHEHNKESAGDEILRRILAGESAALVSDAGMPAISDPGEDLVRRCGESGISIIVVPGPSAVVSALAISGLPTQRFAFEGFLSHDTKVREKHLVSLINSPYTLIFYEAPHKLLATLKDLERFLGSRRISLGRELTKLHEEVLRFTLPEAVAYYQNNPPRGEFVLVVEGAPVQEEEPLSFELAVGMVLALSQQDYSLSSAAKEVSHLTGYHRSKLYQGALAQKS